MHVLSLSPRRPPRRLSCKPTPAEALALRGAYRRHPRYQGCVGHWLFNEGADVTIYDWASGAYGNGTATAVTLPGIWDADQYGPRLTLDGANDYVTLGNASSGDPLDLGQTNTSLSLLVRFYFTSAPGSGQFFPLIKRASGDNNWAYWFVVANASGQSRLQFQMWNATTNPVRNSTTNLSTNTFYTAAVVRDYDANTITVYLNGLVDNSGANSNVNFAVATATDLGRGNITFTNYAPISYHEVRVYNRALSATEILSWHYEPWLEFRVPQLGAVRSIPSTSASSGGFFAWF